MHSDSFAALRASGLGSCCNRPTRARAAGSRSASVATGRRGSCSGSSSSRVEIFSARRTLCVQESCWRATGARGGRFRGLAAVGSDNAEAAVIDGKEISKAVREEIRVEVAALEASTGKVPGLAVVLVGGRKDSATYVRSKKKGCEEAGIKSFSTDLPEDITEADLLKVVEAYNADPAVHGILVQLPLPKHINEETILGAISIEKDVDGFHPLNMGLLAQRGREPYFVPCTPKGCVELLERSGIEISGKTAVVIGRSNIVGMPANLLLQRRDATVTVVHSRTPNAKEVTQAADIVIVACGRAEMVRGDWIKPGAAVIDVGINAVDDASKKRGYRLVGDACFDEIKSVAGAITPVPGGVGPMTIAMLLQNTLEGFKRTVLS